MGYRIYDFGSKSKSAEVMEFEEAAMMAKEGLEKMCELAEDMKEQYGERRGSSGSRSNYRGGGSYGYRERSGYGNRERGGYGEREEWDDDEDMMMRERRMRDSRGRYR